MAAERDAAGAAGRTGWWAMSARLLARSLRRRGMTLVFALVAIVAGAGVAATMLTLKSDLRSKMTRELRRYGPNLLLVPGETRPGATLDESAVRAAVGASGSAMLLAAGALARPDAERGVDAALVGVDFESHRRMNAYWRIEGRWPHSAAPGFVGGTVDGLVGATLAARTGLRPGDTALVRAATDGPALPMRVAGLVRTGEAEDAQLFLPLATVQEVLGLRGRVTLAAVLVDGGPEAVGRAATRLEAAIPGAVARPLRPIAAAQGAILDRLDRMMLLLTGVVLALSALCLATTLFTMVLERESEIGLMRSLGAGDGDVTRMFLGEVTLLGLVGGGIGIALGAAAARLVGRRLFGAAIDPRLAVVPAVLMIALLVSWIAVLVPLRRALAIRPAAALRGE